MLLKEKKNGATVAKKAADKNRTVIDVMVLYSKGLRQQLGSRELMEAKIQHLIDLANSSYDNSNIGARLRLVHSQEVDYDDTINQQDALDALTNNTGVFKGVEGLRDTYGADQVTLLRKYLHSHDGCGLAWLIKHNTPQDGYAVVRNGEIKNGHKTYYCPDTSYAHELGHNMGCAHDRDHAHSQGKYSYSYGHWFQGTDDNWYRTIMSYACKNHNCSQIEYFCCLRVYH